MLKNTYDITSFESLNSLAKQFVEHLRPGTWVDLRGDLGTGKTTFVRACFRSLGYLDEVASPTYPILIEYEIYSKKFVHIDAYRLTPLERYPWDAATLANSIVFIEWSENIRLSPSLVSHRLHFYFKNDRRFVDIK